ncbi:MAG TPA: hypothetical protein VFT27_11415 [Actinomycetota bacterium]|nr:hypothetical protein [Actinomycetota bacterium]
MVHNVLQGRGRTRTVDEPAQQTHVPEGRRWDGGGVASLGQAGMALRRLASVSVANPLEDYPSRDWEDVYRDQYRYDSSFPYVCCPNDTYACAGSARDAGVALRTRFGRDGARRDGGARGLLGLRVPGKRRPIWTRGGQDGRARRGAVARAPRRVGRERGDHRHPRDLDGLRLYLPMCLYLLALWDFGTAAAWFPERRWRTAGAVLLLVGGVTLGTTYQQALVVVGLLLLADGSAVGGLEEAPTPGAARA